VHPRPGGDGRDHAAGVGVGSNPDSGSRCNPVTDGTVAGTSPSSSAARARCDRPAERNFMYAPAETGWASTNDHLRVARKIDTRAPSAVRVAVP
jgi:hypothetical protein